MHQAAFLVFKEETQRKKPNADPNSQCGMLKKTSNDIEMKYVVHCFLPQKYNSLVIKH